MHTRKPSVQESYRTVQAENPVYLGYSLYICSLIWFVSSQHDQRLSMIVNYQLLRSVVYCYEAPRITRSRKRMKIMIVTPCCWLTFVDLCWPLLTFAIILYWLRVGCCNVHRLLLDALWVFPPPPGSGVDCPLVSRLYNLHCVNVRKCCRRED